MTKRTIPKEQMDKLGSSTPHRFVLDCVIPISQYVKSIDIDKLIHIKVTSLDGFKHSIEQIIKDNPDKEIRATGFLFTTKDKKEE